MSKPSITYIGYQFSIEKLEKLQQEARLRHGSVNKKINPVCMMKIKDIVQFAEKKKPERSPFYPKHIAEEKPVKIIRPAAVYTNTSPYGIAAEMLREQNEEEIISRKAG